MNVCIVHRSAHGCSPPSPLPSYLCSPFPPSSPVALLVSRSPLLSLPPRLSSLRRSFSSFSLSISSPLFFSPSLPVYRRFVLFLVLPPSERVLSPSHLRASRSLIDNRVFFSLFPPCFSVVPPFLYLIILSSILLRHVYKAVLRVYARTNVCTCAGERQRAGPSGVNYV